MNKIVINIFIVIMCVILLLGFNASYTSLNIDNLAYVAALGIDVGENNTYKVTFQFVPRSEEGKNGESASSSSTKTIANTVEAPSLNTAINLMNSYLARKLNLSHCKVIIFSEEVAMNGISKEIYSLVNNTQSRPSTNIIICKNTAEKYIKDTNPMLETLITNYYEIFPDSHKYTGYVYNATLGDFFSQLVSSTGEPFAILGGVELPEDSENTNITDNSNVGSIKSTNTSFSKTSGSENIGVAVFKEDKLVGELDADETLCLSIIQEQVYSFFIHIPNPEDIGKSIDLVIYPLGKKKVDVKIVNGSPYIILKEQFTAKILSLSQEKEYLTQGQLDSLSEIANKYLEDLMSAYLYKTSLIFGSDINDFGKYALSNFLTTKDFEEYDWKNNYKNATFKVSLNTKVQTGFKITEIKK